MTIAVFGEGWLGKRIASTVPGAVLLRDDIANPSLVEEALSTCDAVINAAGKTGRPNIDWCEDNREATLRSNVEGPMVLARACARRGVYLLHLGSGCIFQGPSPHAMGWRETDFANPPSFYSRTKYAADLVLEKLPNVGVVRVRMPVDGTPHPRNLITKLAGYKQVIDVVNSVTIVDDLISVIQRLVEKRATGVFHAVNPGTVSHRQLVEMYRAHVDGSYRPEMIGEDELLARGLARAARSSCVLASSRLGEIGIEMRPVMQALLDVMAAYRKAKGA